MKLSELFQGQPDIEIHGIAIDSRKVEPGFIFFCLKGLETDGHRFANKAAEAGAAAIVCQEDVDVAADAVIIKVADSLAESNRCSHLFYGRPSRDMTVFGITGTNGKSTTASIISSIYSAYAPCGYMGTIAVRYGDYSRVPTLTTPDQTEVHSNLAEMRDHGMKAVAMEVSSHGLAMNRTDSVDFDCGIFTNISYDHLDYHGSMEEYLKAKSLLFSRMKPEAVAVLNADDEDSFPLLSKACSCRYVTYGTQVGDKAPGRENAEAAGGRLPDYYARDIRLAPSGTSFVLVHENREYQVQTNLVALYNIYNLLAAVAAMHQEGMSLEQMIPLLAKIPQVDGRMEIIDEGQDFFVIVDYAHTPDGFRKIFQFAEEVAGGDGDIYSVFGSAGKRDKVKRKVLGEIAGGACRKVFVTEEDPRDETAEDIGRAIMEGVSEAGGESVFVGNREEAIGEAIRAAGSGDMVLILGKGDESYMYYEDGRAPYEGDNAIARKMLRRV